MTKDKSKYFQALEEIQESGETNMWGAAPLLHKQFVLELTKEESEEILIEWIKSKKK